MMSCQEAVAAFLNSGQPYRLEPVSGGLINHTNKLTDLQSGRTYLLQQFNLHVFPDPQKIQANYGLLQAHLRSLARPFFIPELQYFPDKQLLFTDSGNQCWRVFRFVENSRQLNGTEDPLQAAAVAETFARLTAACNDLDLSALHTIIPGFHDVQNRYEQFLTAIPSATATRLDKAAVLLSELKSRQRYADLYTHITHSGECKRRVMHHDAKIANVLFDNESGQVICPVDMDTVMPGYFFSDLGDMIRSMAGTADEQCTELDKLQIRPAIYKAITEGYLKGIGALLTPAERSLLHASGLLLIYMQALRFMTDYLQNDRYYRVNHPEQNFDRARNQLVLLNRLEEFLADNYKFTC
jgi:hypothetical protein